MQSTSLCQVSLEDGNGANLRFSLKIPKDGWIEVLYMMSTRNVIYMTASIDQV